MTAVIASAATSKTVSRAVAASCPRGWLRLTFAARAPRWSQVGARFKSSRLFLKSARQLLKPARLFRRGGGGSGLAMVAWLLLFSALSHGVDWPQEVQTAEGPLVVYQPQPESLDGNTLTARAAMSFTPDSNTSGSHEQVFGVFWFQAKLDTDRSQDQVTVRDIHVGQVRWPESGDAGEQRFMAAVNQALERAQFTTSLSRLTASLATAEHEKESLKDINNDPPRIVFKDQLAVLLNFDGPPKFSAIDNSPYERALNTPLTVVRDRRSQKVYLTSGYYWYVSDHALGPYVETQAPPAELVDMVPKPEEERPAMGRAPVIVVATEPTELISTDGRANWQSLPEGQLMYVSNTETPWLRELATNNMYLLLSGRWYRAKQPSGPWTFVRADELPASFAEIPPGSDLGDLRVSVAGTPEAEAAVLDAQVPQTAAISRTDATFTVEYDGAPRFERIPGTKVAYAVNTGAQVIEVEGRFYAVDNGVWFQADQASGPWTVADEIPKQEIAQIPASSPVYNITYVDVYASTPDVVYVGYRPGYLWSYPYYGVPVYGTGWHYRPYWRGRYYYPRPPTWGLNVGYNNWTGWTFGVSWSSGFLNFGVNWNAGWHDHGHGVYHPGHCCNGWYGGGYRGPVVINTGDIHIGNKVNIGNKVKLGDSRRFNPHNVKNAYKTHNVYSNSGKRLASQAQVKRDLQTAIVSRNKANNVFADQQGKVLQRAGGQWQERAGNQWKQLSSDQQQQIRDKARSVDARKVDKSAARGALKNQGQPPSQPPKSMPSQTLPSQTRPTHSLPSHSLPQRPSHTLPQQRPQPFQEQRLQQLNRANMARQMGVQRQQLQRQQLQYQQPQNHQQPPHAPLQRQQPPQQPHRR